VRPRVSYAPYVATHHPQMDLIVAFDGEAGFASGQGQ